MTRSRIQLTTGVLSLLLIILFFPGVYATSFVTDNQTAFDAGTYTQTVYNATRNAVQLNGTVTLGNYTSKIFDASRVVWWQNITWLTNAQKELPNNKGMDGTLNMSGNFLLFHLNNDSRYGENDIRVYDFSGSGHDGTPTANASFNNTKGKFSMGAYTFNTQTDSITLPDVATLKPSLPVSIITWISTRANASANGQGILELGREKTKHKGVWAELTSTNALSVSYGDGGQCNANGKRTKTSARSLIADRWYHVALIIRGSTDMDIYINGINDTNATYSGSGGSIVYANASAVGLITACPNGAQDYSFNGTIDEIAVFNRSLSKQEIIDMYTAGITHANLSVRNCDDAGCVGDNFMMVNSTSPQNLSTINRYFQYQFLLDTENMSFVPYIQTVTLNDDPTVDVQAPNVTNPFPVNGSIFAHSAVVGINATIIDDVSINNTLAEVTFPNTTRRNFTLMSGATNLYGANLSDTSQLGIYVARFIANDSSGNKNGSISVSFNVTDMADPSVTAVLPQNATIEAGAMVSISANVTDDINVSTVLVNLTYPNSSVSSFSTTSNDTMLLNDTTQLGTYNFTIVANDTSGNENTTETGSFTVQDTTPPTIENVTPENYTGFLENSVVNVSADAWDFIGIDTVIAVIMDPNGDNATYALVHTVDNQYATNVTNTTVRGQYQMNTTVNDTNGNRNSTRTYFTIERFQEIIPGEGRGFGRRATAPAQAASSAQSAPAASAPTAATPATTTAVSTTANVPAAVAQALAQPNILFDIRLQIDPKSKEAAPGSDILTTVGLVNFGPPGATPVDVTYAITDWQGSTVLQQTEHLSVETQTEFLKKFTLPKGLKTGLYTITGHLAYRDQEASAQDTFHVTTPRNTLPWIMGIIGAALLGLASLFHGGRKEKEQSEKKNDVKQKTEAASRHDAVNAMLEHHGFQTGKK